MGERIYLDHAATTPMVPEAVEAVARALRDFGNPSSPHSFGRDARRMVEDARARVAALVGAPPEDIVFTGGATEANNTVVSWAGRTGMRFVTSAVEHPSVLEPARRLEASGGKVTVLGTDPTGRVDAGEAGRALAGGGLLSVMFANNETGVLQPVAELAARARGAGGVFHTDATQAVGRVPVDLAGLGADLASFTAHKFNGPKGVGALFVRRGLSLEPLLDGGGQEAGRRAGTLNVPAIAGMGAAAAVAARDLGERAAAVGALRDRLEKAILSSIPRSAVNGPPAPRLPGHSSVSFAHADAEAVVIGLDLVGIAVSAGSACSSGSVSASHVLKAMGLSLEDARSTVRFSLGLGNTAGEVDRAVEAVAGVVARLRAVSPSWKP
jgi:cysteine desulfurase